MPMAVTMFVTAPMAVTMIMAVATIMAVASGPVGMPMMLWPIALVMLVRAVLAIVGVCVHVRVLRWRASPTAKSQM